ncbi:hypothetical protein N7U66_03020 [Lacinutrix neustonica]|uniref:Uncharacterized protein n=1 Tax=Lacinutrix neustonica TaxID=2980107 RepID=A0A9E8MYN7_9FLAO|nr:hypothetical protein [Lacinutrix neustonica]WAC02670.1 hypothetical protein N7U66_03020 [Lacinutrix neustonica]
MGRVCREIQEWVEEEIEKPIETWEERAEERCSRRKCKWWCACCNKWFCWIEILLVKIIKWVVVIVGKWVTRVVCEIISFILDVIALVVNLILSIPIIGGIIRTLLNWITEIIWRIVGLFDFIGSLLGIRPRKKMYFGLIIPTHEGKPIANQTDLQPQIDAAIEHMDRLCNVNLIFTGSCNSAINAPNNPLEYPCNAEGFFSDWWIQGSFYELATALCKFEDGWRRVLGYGAEIVVFVVDDVTPDGKGGCSMAASTNYIMTESNTSNNMIAHEMGHACVLLHRDDRANLMFPTVGSSPQTLTNWQVSVIRWSKHCVYI